MKNKKWSLKSGIYNEHLDPSSTHNAWYFNWFISTTLKLSIIENIFQWKSILAFNYLLSTL